MQISLLLMQQIAQLFLILLMGYAVVKTCKWAYFMDKTFTNYRRGSARVWCA